MNSLPSQLSWELLQIYSIHSVDSTSAISYGVFELRWKLRKKQKREQKVGNLKPTLAYA